MSWSRPGPLNSLSATRPSVFRPTSMIAISFSMATTLPLMTEPSRASLRPKDSSRRAAKSSRPEKLSTADMHSPDAGRVSRGCPASARLGWCCRPDAPVGASSEAGRHARARSAGQGERRKAAGSASASERSAPNTKREPAEKAAPGCDRSRPFGQARCSGNPPTGQGRWPPPPAQPAATWDSANRPDALAAADGPCQNWRRSIALPAERHP